MRSKTSKESSGKDESLGAKLLESIRQMKAGEIGRETPVALSLATEARHRTGLSRSAFAKALSISPRTLQEWEQGRRKPSGAARSLLRIAHRHPQVIAELLGEEAS
ncbi:MAG: hypothetical protein RLZZ174_2147 [Pseudomonadota bacterium]|jgi:putative transcriptional regulator|nr:helix-turn-helix domain-containing protein [Pseudomonadales bacterium]MDA0955915.1 helix-turn-helix domain-containing protein [Pseudomonadota bacterium]